MIVNVKAAEYFAIIYFGIPGWDFMIRNDSLDRLDQYTQRTQLFFPKFTKILINKNEQLYLMHKQ